MVGIMDSIKFEDIWTKSNEDLIATQKFWDLRAEEFNDIKDKQKEKDELIDLLINKGFINKEYNVLDIGCGTGKYILEFARIGKDATGIDISPNMIKYAKENAKNMNLSNVSFEIIPWQELDVNKIKWNKKFDFVFASMSPAINSKETLLKMMEVSKKYCFMSGFVYRKDKIKDELVKRIIGENSNKSINKNIYCAFNILWNMGIYPEITYKNVVWNKEISCDKAIEMYTILLQGLVKKDDLIKEKIKSYIEKISYNGKIEEIIEAKIAWMLWRI